MADRCIRSHVAGSNGQFYIGVPKGPPIYTISGYISLRRGIATIPMAAVPNNQNNGRNLNFNSSNVNPLNNNNRAYGFGVRSSQEFILVRGRESFECKLQKWLNVIRDRICLRIFFRPITRRGRRKEILRASLRLRLIWNIILWSCMNR